MTAMVSVKATTRDERFNAYRNEWIQTAVNYLLRIGVYAPDELEGANELAETLWESSDNDEFWNDEALRLCPEDAVDEEMTYWGE